MMKRPTFKTDHAWKLECLYIDKVAKKRGMVREMNYDLPTFVRYFAMQRDMATRDGQHDAAQYIQHVIDDMEDK